MSTQIAAPRPVVERATESELAGTVIATWYLETRVLLLDYLAMRPGQRGGGLGGALLSESVSAWATEKPRTGGMMLAVLHAHPTLLGDDANEIDSEPIATVLHLQAGDADTHDAARTELIATAAANPTLPLLRADRPGDVPIGIPD